MPETSNVKYDHCKTLTKIRRNLIDLQTAIQDISQHIQIHDLEDLFLQFHPKLADNTISLLSGLGVSDNFLKIYTDLHPYYLPLAKHVLHEKIIGHPITLNKKSKVVYNIIRGALPLLSPFSPKDLRHITTDCFYPSASGYMTILTSIAFDTKIVFLNQDNPADPYVYDAHRFSYDDGLRDVIYIQHIPGHFRYLKPISE